MQLPIITFIVLAVVVVLLAKFEAAPLNFPRSAPPCPTREQEDPVRILKILLNNYIITDPIDKKFSKQKSKVPKSFKHTFKNRIPVCKTNSVEILDLIDRVTIPKKIMEVKLVNILDRHICKQVKKEIIYLEEEKDCNKNIDARMYVIKTREIVVAYEYMI